MKLLYILADLFIWAFGITRPTEQTRRKAALFILTLLLILLAGIIVAAIAVRQATT